ncbi:hypothetical protein UA08_00628 [Talaromyces atroroseus]|uniref:WSC domain-containing protein n=1 Tax=Talaromyces atroroseus TaxID=1441469 RepID=A0A225B3Z3_TALAT|nr:hypothetical protein UA08_00628 [Talaromyces atroroseus]OKL64448.1 hypothetical protein UA08_00628 [Talaromyces atroroseus]
MRFSTSNIAITASSLILWAPRVAAINYNATTYVDCYKSVPGFIDNGTYTYQSTGWCQEQCVPMGYSVMALLDGKSCYCGDELPPNSTQTSGCDTPCQGFGQDDCGGTDVYGVFLTGLTSDVSIMSESSSTSSSSTTSTSASSSSTTNGVTVITQAGETIVVTASSSATSAAAKSSGHSDTAGIAAGIVVGIVGASAIIGAAIFFLRRRQKQRVEDEYRRNAEINAFAQKPSSVSSDARWDSDYMAQRRQSNGSIADDQDFSRRILQVTNPDR